jgi:hypothetical protein
MHTPLSSLRLSPTRETEIVDELEQAVRSLNPDLSLTTVQTLEEIQAHSMATHPQLWCATFATMPSATRPKSESSW